MLVDALRSQGQEVLAVREPGGTAAAERIRDLLADPATPLEPLAELLLFCAARADLLGREIRPALQSGITVVCDRFTDSTLAYQGVARGLGSELVARLNAITTGGLSPDLTLYLRLDPKLAHGRAVAAAAGADRFEDEGAAFQEQVARAYDELARSEPERIVTIAAEGSPEDVHDRVMEAVTQRQAGAA